MRHLLNIRKQDCQITQQLVKQLFAYKDGFLYWKIKRRNANIGDCASKRHKATNRYEVYVNRKSYLSYRLIFLWHYGYLPQMVDHIDRDCANDKIENLRAATRCENARNKQSEKGSTSKYLGVGFHKRDKYWQARINIDGKNKHLGSFKTEIAAALAYNEAAIIYHGEFANLNII